MYNNTVQTTKYLTSKIQFRETFYESQIYRDVIRFKRRQSQIYTELFKVCISVYRLCIVQDHQHVSHTLKIYIQL